MSEEEALAIVHEALRFHSDDWNFPSDMRERMQRLVQGEKAYGDFYQRDLRIDATMMVCRAGIGASGANSYPATACLDLIPNHFLKYSSPYPGVRAVADPRDDTEVPTETLVSMHQVDGGDGASSTILTLDDQRAGCWGGAGAGGGAGAAAGGGGR